MWRLEAGIAEPEQKVVARKQLDKHSSAATNTNATIGELLEAMFSMRSVPRLHTDDEGGKESQSIVGR
jgi:hypothetical protein